MKQFLSSEFDPIACRKQLSDLQELLRRKSLSELDDILPFFRERQQLSLFISSYNTNISRRDRIAFEYDIFGDFRSDLVVGDSVSHSYLWNSRMPLPIVFLFPSPAEAFPSGRPDLTEALTKF